MNQTTVNNSRERSTYLPVKYEDVAFEEKIFALVFPVEMINAHRHGMIQRAQPVRMICGVYLYQLTHTVVSSNRMPHHLNENSRAATNNNATLS